MADVLIRFRRLVAGAEAADRAGSTPEDADAAAAGGPAATPAWSFDDLGLLRLRRKILDPPAERPLTPRRPAT